MSCQNPKDNHRKALHHVYPPSETRAQTPEKPNTSLTSTSPGPSAATVMLAVLSLSYMLSYFDRMLIVVVAEMVKQEFLLSDKELSLLTGASFVILYGVTGIASGWLLDRYSRKRILAWALTIWSAMTMVCGLAQSFAQLAIARAGVGIGEAANVPAAMSVIGDLYPPAKRPMAVAIFYTGGMAGMLVTFLFGSWLATNFGWRTAFLAAGPPGLLLALLVAVYTREPVREAPKAGRTETLESATSFQLVRTNKALVWLIFAGSVSTFANTGMVSWLPIFFIRSHHLSMTEIGIFFGPVLAGGMATGMLLGGSIGNRIAARSVSALARFSTLTMVALVPAYVALLLVSSLPVALLLTFFTTSISVLWSPSYTGAWQTICDPRVRGLAGGISGFSCAIIGGAICPFVVGILSDLWSPALGAESLRYALIAGLVFCAGGAALFARATRLMEA